MCIPRHTKSLGEMREYPSRGKSHRSWSKVTATNVVRAFRDEWVRQLKENDIPEAELSVKYIVEHAMQTVVSGHHRGGLVS